MLLEMQYFVYIRDSNVYLSLPVAGMESGFGVSLGKCLKNLGKSNTPISQKADACIQMKHTISSVFKFEM